MRQIGFGNFEKAWEGPVYLELLRYSDHTKTIRYRCELRTRAFDLYAPLFMLKGPLPGEVPERLIVAIGRAPGRLNQIGFSAAPYQPIIDSEVCEFVLAEEKVNSVRYDMIQKGQVYALYVPKEIFGREPHPRSVYLRIGIVPDDEST